jgi:hypothetical protein
MLSAADAQTLPLLLAAPNAARGPQWWYMSDADPDHDRAGGRYGGRARALHPPRHVIGAVKG